MTWQGRNGPDDLLLREGDHVSKIVLNTMTKTEFQNFYTYNRQDIVQDFMEQYKMSEENAVLKFQKIWESFAPNGHDDKNNHYLNTNSPTNGKNVGYLWLTEKKLEEKTILILSSLHIYNDHRRQGFGEGAMISLETYAKNICLNEIRFQVDGTNTAAFALYRKLGYDVFAYLMKKHIC